MIKKDIKLQKAYMLVCLIKKYFEIERSGGRIQLIVNGNYGRACVQHCLDFSIDQNDYWGEQISRLLLTFNDEEQEQIMERASEIVEQMN